MELLAIAPPDFDVDIALAYATPANITGKPIYRRADCYLPASRAQALRRAIDQAARLGLRLRIFDAVAASEAQWVLWNHTPDPEFSGRSARGSPHSRGVAVRSHSAWTVRARNWIWAPRSTPSRPCRNHGDARVSADAQRNRLLLLGLMSERILSHGTGAYQVGFATSSG